VEDEIMRGHLSESPARGAPAGAGCASAQLDVWQHFIANNPLLAALLADSMGEPLDRIPSMCVTHCSPSRMIPTCCQPATFASVRIKSACSSSPLPAFHPGDALSGDS